MTFSAPMTLEVDFNDPQIAWSAGWMPQVQYDGRYTVSYTADDFLSIYKALLAMFWIAKSEMNP